MSDLKDSVILPRDDFYELSTVAFDNNHIPTTNERVAQSLQNLAFVATVALGISASTWGYAVAKNWLEERRNRRKIEYLEKTQKS